MKKLKSLIICSLCLVVGGMILFNNSSETVVVSNKLKAADIDLGNAVCFTTEAEAKYYIEQAQGKELKPLLTYMYGNVQAKNDAGTDPYYCDNPDVSIRTFNICNFDGYYLDAALTKPVNPVKVGDVLKPIEYIKDSNGCITGINYITTLYAKCSTTPTSTTSTTTKKVTPSSSNTTTRIVSKDGGDPVTETEPENPETGDSIWLYVGAGIVLIAGSGLTFKKLLSK